MLLIGIYMSLMIRTKFDTQMRHGMAQVIETIGFDFMIKSFICDHDTSGHAGFKLNYFSSNNFFSSHALTY